LGGAVSNILEAAGNSVIRANYLGDIGLHVIKWLYNYETNHKGEQPVDNPTRWMGNLYAEADRLFVDDPDFETGVRKYFQRWDEKDPDVVALWKKTRKWSIDGFDQIYEQLGVKFDKVYFESEVEESGKVVVEELIKKGIAIDDRPEGPVYVDLDTLLNTKEEFRIAVILRSDGTSLYATKELPLAIQKFKEYNLDKSIYVVDVRQSLHMKQIFKILDLMGYEWSKKLEHLAYEIVNLPGNVTMSSREGTVVLIEDLIQESTKRALEIVSEKNPDLTQTQKNKIAYDVAIGAIKYPMLSRENTKIVTFDWESALDFNGQSAPYIQYAHVRAGSILKKMGAIILDPIRIVTPLEKIEINIIEQLTRLPDEIKRASNELKPSIITNYAYNLARTFNEFYNLCPVLSVEFDLKMLRLAIVKSTQNCLAVCLNLLGISAPQTM
jgi:arginyl-tRNA synthetase